jgi:hypothetical protein
MKRRNFLKLISFSILGCREKKEDKVNIQEMKSWFTDNPITLTGGDGYDDAWRLRLLCNGNVQDTSGNDNHGTAVVNNFLNEDQLGRLGGCLGFNGTTNYVDFGAKNIIDVTQSFSVFAFVRITSDSLTTSRVIFSNNNGTSAGIKFRVETSGVLNIRIPGGTHWTSSFILSTATWYWVGVTYNASTGEKIIYVDDSSEVVTGSNPTQSGNSAYVGADTNGAVNKWAGRISNLFIFQKVLNSSEITALKTLGDLYHNTASVLDAFTNIPIGGEVIFNSGHFKLNETIMINKSMTIRIKPGVVIEPVPESDMNPWVFAPDSKTHLYIFSCIEVDNVNIIDEGGSVVGLADGLQSFGFVQAFGFRECENIFVNGLTTYDLHNSLHLVGVDNSEFRNLTWLGNTFNLNYKNAPISAQFCDNLYFENIYCQNGEETIDLNGDCTHCSGVNIVGDNLTEAVLELNGGQFYNFDIIEGDQLDSPDLVRFQVYGAAINFGHGYVTTMGYNRNVTLTNIQGNPDFIDESGSNIADQTIT